MAEPDETRLTDEHTANLSLVEGELRVDGSRSECRDQRLGCIVTGSGGEKHDVAGFGSEGRDEGLVHRLQASSGRQGSWQLGRAVALGRCESLGGFDQGQRVAVCRRDEQSEDRTINAGRHETCRVGRRQTPQLDRVEPVDRRPAGCAKPGREQDRDGIVVETARREQHRARRAGIEPVQIVHDDEHRRRLRCGREQGERAGGDQVPIVGRHRRAPTDGGLERSSLRGRDAVEVVTQGRKQLQQTSVVEPRLGLDAAGAYSLVPGGRRLHRIEQ
jgi:hypothetical protein